MDELYKFVYRGVLTDESLDKAGRVRNHNFGAEEATRMNQALAFAMLGSDMLDPAHRMSIVYKAIHAFENSVRQLVVSTMTDEFHEVWWTKVPDRIQKKVTSRMEEDAKFRWHGSRVASEIMYCDFGDLSTVIVTNWTHFEDVLVNMEWAKSVLNTLEMSRNIVMHGGILSMEDVERIGMNIRDWIRQTG